MGCFHSQQETVQSERISCTECNQQNESWQDNADFLIKQMFGSFQWSIHIKEYLRKYRPNIKNIQADNEYRNELMVGVRSISTNYQINSSSFRTASYQSEIQKVIENTDIMTEQFRSQPPSMIQISKIFQKQEQSIEVQQQQVNINFRNNSIFIDLAKQQKRNILLYNCAVCYKQITSKMEQQFQMQEHPIANIIRLFIEYYQMKYIYQQNYNLQNVQEIRKDIYSDNINNIQRVFSFVEEDMMFDGEHIKKKLDIQQNEIKAFITFLYNVIWNYYQMEEFVQLYNNDGESFFNVENISNFLCSFIFQDNIIYSTLFKLQCESEKENLKLFEINIQKMKDKTINDFEVPVLFCLNEETLNYYKKKKVISEMVQLQQNTPYQNAIQCLKQIQIVNSPVQKLRVIQRTSSLIDECIAKFYEGYSIPFVMNYDADQLLHIFVYIITKSEIYDLPAHCKLIEHNIIKSLLTSHIGIQFQYKKYNKDTY